MVRTLERGGQRVGCNESGHFRKRAHSHWLQLYAENRGLILRMKSGDYPVLYGECVICSLHNLRR